jgi:hypothetical protein
VAFTDVNEVWPIVSNGQPLLEWNPDGEDVFPAFFEQLAEAVRRLEKHGFVLSMHP